MVIETFCLQILRLNIVTTPEQLVAFSNITLKWANRKMGDVTTESPLHFHALQDSLRNSFQDPPALSQVDTTIHATRHNPTDLLASRPHSRPDLYAHECQLLLLFAVYDVDTPEHATTVAEEAAHLAILTDQAPPQRGRPRHHKTLSLSKHLQWPIPTWGFDLYQQSDNGLLRFYEHSYLLIIQVWTPANSTKWTVLADAILGCLLAKVGGPKREVEIFLEEQHEILLEALHSTAHSTLSRRLFNQRSLNQYPPVTSTRSTDSYKSQMNGLLAIAFGLPPTPMAHYKPPNYSSAADEQPDSD